MGSFGGGGGGGGVGVLRFFGRCPVLALVAIFRFSVMTSCAHLRWTGVPSEHGVVVSCICRMMLRYAQVHV